MTIPTSVLSTADPDTSAAQLVYTVTSSLQGYVQLNGQSVSTFTQADLDNGLVTFVHDGSEGSQAGFYFTVSDGTTTIAEQLFSIVVSPVNDPPAVTSLGDSMAEVSAASGAVLALACVQ